MTRVCIHQPDFLPYLGFFDRLLTTDTFILLDDVQFIRRGWQHRDKIKTPQGPTWLGPQLKKGSYHQSIAEVELHPDREWVEANLNLVRQNYREATFFENQFAELEAIWRTPYERLIELNLALLDFMYGLLKIDVRVILSSSLSVDTSSSQRLVDLVAAVGGTEYLSGTGALDYLDKDLFEKAEIGLEIQDFRHPEYPQLHGPFVSHLSCLDLVLNCGPDSAKILRS